MLRYSEISWYVIAYDDVDHDGDGDDIHTEQSVSML